jgi:glycosyltransferase involved in cell wall biosynthesis
MNITAFSMTPLYPDRVMGGAQKQLHTVVMHLAGLGHTVNVVCTRATPAHQRFRWHQNATIHPIFAFKQPFPEPYATPIYNIANAIQALGDVLAQSDVFYSHDGGFIFPYVYQTIPTVTSLRSTLFSETLQSAFLFQGDDLIVISNHQRDTLLNTVGRFFPALAARTHVIYNGLNFDVFQPTDTHDVLSYLPQIDPQIHTIALFPHRPEAPKGIFDVIDVARRLVHDHHLPNLRVLVPRWIEDALSPDDRAFYEQLQGRIGQAGLSDHFVFHEWIPQALMPALYSLGDVTFAIGSYVETFGNVPYESLACGTPSIVARVGPARELLPERLIDKIDYGDTATAAAIAAEIIQQGRRTSDATLAYLKTHFQQADMTAAYADVILNATQRGPLPYVYRPLPQQFRPAPWVYQTDDGRYYHDFLATYQADLGLSADPLVAYRAGWLVPVYGEDK